MAPRAVRGTEGDFRKDLGSSKYAGCSTRCGVVQRGHDLSISSKVLSLKATGRRKNRAQTMHCVFGNVSSKRYFRSKPNSLGKY